MTLDELEQLAKAAQETHPTPWKCMAMVTADWVHRDPWEEPLTEPMKPEGFVIADAGPEDSPHDGLVVEHRYLDRAAAHYIAAVSPDVVLGLIARIRELERPLSSPSVLDEMMRALEANPAPRIPDIALTQERVNALLESDE